MKPPGGTTNTQVTIGGDASGHPCCPMSIARLLSNNVPIPPTPALPACSTSLPTARYELSLFSATTFVVAGRPKTNYTFVVMERGGCDASVINACCNMQLDALSLTIVAASSIDGVYVLGARHQDLSFAPDTANGMTTMTLNSLSMGELPAAGADVVVTVEGDVDLCSSATASGAAVGECNYQLSAQVCGWISKAGCIPRDGRGDP